MVRQIIKDANLYILEVEKQLVRELEKERKWFDKDIASGNNEAVKYRMEYQSPRHLPAWTKFMKESKDIVYSKKDINMIKKGIEFMTCVISEDFGEYNRHNHFTLIERYGFINYYVALKSHRIYGDGEIWLKPEEVWEYFLERRSLY